MGHRNGRQGKQSAAGFSLSVWGTLLHVEDAALEAEGYWKKDATGQSAKNSLHYLNSVYSVHILSTEDGNLSDPAGWDRQQRQ